MLQVTLLCTQQLAGSSDTAAVVTLNTPARLAHCHKLVLQPAATSSAETVTSTCSSKRITLEGGQGMQHDEACYPRRATHQQQQQGNRAWCVSEVLASP
jgi:hypothetical protein